MLIGTYLTCPLTSGIANVDGVRGQPLNEREEFVEAVSHDCRVVQVALLASRRRTDLAAAERIRPAVAGTYYGPVPQRLEGAALEQQWAERAAEELIAELERRLAQFDDDGD